MHSDINTIIKTKKNIHWDIEAQKWCLSKAPIDQVMETEPNLLQFCQLASIPITQHIQKDIQTDTNEKVQGARAARV